ncbi:hypothetical protein Hanom_Chr15g01377941 [Helianthus anomalus]
MEQQDKTNQRILREIDDIKKQKTPTEDHSPLVPRMLDFVTPTNAAQQSRVSNTQPQGSSTLQHGSLAMTLPQGSSIHQLGSVTMNQPQGSFHHLKGYMETFPVQGSYFNNQGSSSRV